MNRLEGIFVYDIDDLQSVAADHLAERSREAEHAERIVAEEVERYQRKLKTVDAAPAIVQLQQSAEAMRQLELERAGGRLQSLTPEQMAAVEAVTRGLMNKLLHHPMMAIRSAAREGDAGRLNYLAEVFHLETRADEAEADKSGVQLKVKENPGYQSEVSEGASQPVTVGQSPSVRKV
jgi:glutamyl-tRNA reductase